MKHKYLCFFMAITIAMFCGNIINAQPKKKTPVKKQTVAARYQCPMKCEGDKTYQKPGRCPECGMSMKILKKG